MRPPQKATSTQSFPFGGGPLLGQGVDADGRGNRIERHIDDRGRPAGRGGLGGGAESLPLDLPGSFTCTCESTNPGITTMSPKSISGRASPISTITPCSIRIDAGRTSPPTTTLVLPMTAIGDQSYRRDHSFLPPRGTTR